MARKSSYYKDPVVEKILESDSEQKEALKEEEPKVLVLSEKKEELKVEPVKELVEPTKEPAKELEVKELKATVAPLKQVPVVVPPKVKTVAPKPKEIKKLTFSGFYSYEENYKKIRGLLSYGWKIIKEEKTTTSHKITLENQR
jgi:hypothetical protein